MLWFSMGQNRLKNSNARPNSHNTKKLKMCVPSALLSYFYTIENLKVLPPIILC